MAEGRYLLGLDAGNTVVKAVLFDLDGTVLASAGRHGDTSKPAPGHVERNLDELWANAAEVIQSCLDTSGIEAGEIIAVGCAGHGNGLYLLNWEDAPLLGIQSLDTRATGLAEELVAAAGDRIHATTLQRPWPSQTATLLAWVRRNQPELYQRAGTVFLCKDFLTFRLTGRKVSEISDMSGAGLVRLPGCTPDGVLLSEFGLEGAAALLPEIVQPTDVVGTVTRVAADATGLAEGTPVVAGLFDVVASALGSGAEAPGEASIIAGSWSINQVISETPLQHPDIFMVAAFAPDRFMGLEASATSAVNLEWYVQEVLEQAGVSGNIYDYCNTRIASIDPAPDDPIYLPYLYGSRDGGNWRAAFLGLAGWHSDAHLLRAIYEGVAFEHLRHVQVLAASGVHFDNAFLSGGGTRSPLWSQMFSDVLGIPVAVSACNETGALGGAIAAGVGAGVFGDLSAGVRAMTRTDRHHTPDAGRRVHYSRRFELYRDALETLAPLWSSFQARHGS